ncbi:MAG: bifunctional glutamate N-acetyltransferase/amino-acid acetyltransferase ArgJ [Hyphomicrobiaceae bacterium]
MSKISPFAPQVPVVAHPVAGVRFATAEAGIKYKNRTDLLLVLFDEGTTVAGQLTRSKTCSAAVDWCRACREAGRARALVVNSGNSNAFTGKLGRETVDRTVAAAAEAAGCTPGEVFVASTGVIGQPFDAALITRHLPALAAAAAPDGLAAAAGAIMTTDTYPKIASRTLQIAGRKVTINGIAKGAGMIAPDMATMFTFVFTDQAVAKPALDRLLALSVAESHNAITIDGDTSTSDTVLAFATGRAGTPAITDIDAPEAAAFVAAFRAVMHDLALQIVKDGEGVTKFVTLKVTGAESIEAARRIGLSIANSPLVKTALAGSDPNWGRIVMAIGKSGEAADRDRIAIRFGNISVAREGAVDPTYTEAAGATYFKGSELEIGVDVGVGDGMATVYTCDLTAEYVSINADYRS